MSSRYLIPSPSEPSLARLWELAGVPTPAPAELLRCRILQVEVDPGARWWRLYLEGSLPEVLLREVETLLSRAVDGVDRVYLDTMPGPVLTPEAAGLEGARTEPDPPAAGPPQDDAAYARWLQESFRPRWEESLPADAAGAGGKPPRGRNGHPPGESGAAFRWGKPIPAAAAITPMSALQEPGPEVVVQGEVIAIESRPVRASGGNGQRAPRPEGNGLGNGREAKLVQIDLTDRTDSIRIKLFDRGREPHRADVEEAVRPGTWLRVRGVPALDRFREELVLEARDAEAIEAPRRVDTAPEKRVELHLHTKMSALDGLSPVDQVIAQAAAWGHPAVALTDHGVVQAFPDAYRAAKKAGIKVIFGMEGYLCDDPSPRSRTYHIILLARTQQGLRNLYELVSLSHLRYFYRKPRVPRQELIRLREGLIVGSACEAGELFRAMVKGAPDDELLRIASFYDYLEIQPLANNRFMIDQGVAGSEEDLRAFNRRIVSLADRLDKPVVATGDVHFVEPEDQIFRQIIQAGQGYEDVENPAPLYLRPTQEMLEEFAYLGEERARDVVVTQPRRLAESVEDLVPVPDGLHAPELPNAAEEITQMARRRAAELYGDPLPERVQNRLDRELNSIVGNGFASLYLAAHRLVRRSLEDGYLVGSRGSVGSSLVATLCDITEVNPLPPHYLCRRCHHLEFFDDGSVGAGVDLPPKACPGCGEPLERHGFDIPFETFLGFHGEKVPDIDLNFSGEYQPTAHKVAEEIFGPDHVYRAGTIATLADRTAYGFVRKFLEEKGKQARGAEISRLVQGCTGVRRTTGQHPGGLMILPQGYEIYQFTPIQFPANDRDSGVVTTHFDYHAISERLVKLDLLGHDDPTVLRMLEEETGVPARSVPLDDPETMALFSSVASLGIQDPSRIGSTVGTIGIPEFGTRFVRQMLEETRPTTFSQLVRISGFSHGTNVWTNNAQDLIRTGVADLNHAIATRDDIMIHLIRQGIEPEQAFGIMEHVRKGKGLTAEEEAVMKAHGVPQWYVDSCRKISYMFPKAHAVAYVTMAFRIAYYKVHHPAAFYAVYFSVRAEEFDAGLVAKGEEAIRREMERLEQRGAEATARDRNVVTILEVVLEALARGIGFSKVDLYRSHPTRFQVEPDSQSPAGARACLRPPLVALPGVGQQAALAIAEARRGTPFGSMENLQSRARVSRTVVDVLREHGALGDLPERDQLSLF
ncbi:PolC-type DNA polymerase III [Limnochorda pilosa]|uniref:DNA polymerase III PolC-type n=1 Tax=Limnochorda pilosa TaxID=1555112 RepID=A0A0K2SKI7_LIMPI|nr:PolC-type DNA polymerase III [Limnochorda pilosa]BAS27532.1 DNA polymerase III subunit alpha [Limnochorda pilosa]